MYIPYKLADGSVVLVELKPDVAEFILKNDREMAIRQIKDIADARVNRYRKED
jgi:hypothetical protein